jgi:hypothetical protein
VSRSFVVAVEPTAMRDRVGASIPFEARVPGPGVIVAGNRGFRSGSTPYNYGPAALPRATILPGINWLFNDR